MDNADSGRAKRRGMGLKITALLLTYLLLASIANIAWRLLHLPHRCNTVCSTPASCCSVDSYC